jgi:hypothetical protein
MKVSGQLYAPSCFIPRERAPGPHWIGGWVSPRAVLDTVVKRKILTLHWESNPDHPACNLVTIPTELSRLINEPNLIKCFVE